MDQKVAIVTGASSGIGLGITQALLEKGYRVVATSRAASARLTASPHLEIVDGDIGQRETAERVVQAALKRFDRLDLLVNNAGIFMAKPFPSYTAADTEGLISTNLLGFVHVTQRALEVMAPRGSGQVVSITTSLAGQPVAGVPSALPILIKGGLEAATRSLAIEYASQGLRFNAIAPGIIDTPMHPKENHGFLAGLSPMKRLGRVEEVAAAVLFLESAAFVTGEVLHLDGGAHAGRW